MRQQKLFTNLTKTMSFLHKNEGLDQHLETSKHEQLEKIMHVNWKLPINRVLASSVAALLATTSVYAIPKGPCDTKPEVCCEEPKPGPFAFSYPLDMNITCPRDFYVHVDGLAFQAKQDGMEFAISNSEFDPSTSPTTGISNGEVLGFSNDHSDWDYNPGLRFGMGFYLDHDAWQVDFTWTWLNITNYKNESIPPSSTNALIPEFLIPGSESATMSATNNTVSASWKASYNVLDARLGKPYYVSRYLILNPHFGVRAGWIDQHFSVDYGGAYSGVARAIAHSDNDLWTFGARTGLNTDWILGKGWSLFGNVAGSLLFGKFDIDQHLDYGDSDGYNLDDDFYQNVTNVEIALGLSWGQHFDKNKYRVGLRAAYEFHEWFDINNIRKFYGPSPYYANDRVARGNLNLNGFSLSLSLDL
ncbi:MAG TPA: hypothetical protein DCE71_02265 [Parachlamydiales bacterium]|nr:hypothetical protein [Parachlamydiales bacterium]